MTARRFLGFAGSVAMLVACSLETGANTPAGAQPARQSAAPSAGTPVKAPAPVAVAAASTAGLPKVVVHKSPSCGCCAVWVKHMREAGFSVDVRDSDNLEPVKKRLGVPLGKGSCHTAQVGHLVVEGHVPAGDIKRLLAAPGDARGLVLPGMPMGSPGMEMPDGRVQRYTVEKVNADGSTTPFATHGN